MKKLFALFSALMLLCTIALAEDYTVEMQILTMDDGFTFAAPAAFSYREVSEEERKEKNLFLVGYGQEEDLLFLCTIEGIGMSLEDRKAIRDETDGGRTELVTNEHGHQVLVYVHDDNMLAGYEFMVSDGVIISFLWGSLTHGKPVTENPYIESIFTQGINAFGFAGAEAAE